MEQRFRRNPIVELAPLDEEVILFHPEANRFVVLNGTGSFLWGLLEAPHTPSNLAKAVCGQFAAVEFLDALRDVEELLEQMVSQELVIVDAERKTRPEKEVTACTTQ